MMRAFKRKDKLKICLEGEITIYNAAELRDKLVDKLATEINVARFDLSAVTEFDTAGFQILAFGKKECDSRGIVFEIEAASLAVDEVLDLYHVAPVFGVPEVLSAASAES